jgi:uncharacterized protein (DUF4415 family)
MSRERTPVSSRKGIKIDDETRRAYEQRDKSHDNDPDYGRLTPDQWATAMRRDEFFRPIKKHITIRLDADVLAYYQRQGAGYQTRINEVLRSQMEAELQRSAR